MPGNLPKTILAWKEPRALRKAFRLANRGCATLWDYFVARCKQVGFHGIWFLLLALLPVFAGKNVLPWPSIVALPIFCSVLLAYFINTIVWVMPQEVRITDKGIQRQRGAGWSMIPWANIGRIELAMYEQNNRAFRMLLLYPTQPALQNAPAMIGVAEAITDESLDEILGKYGSTVERADPNHSTALMEFMEAVRKGEAADAMPFWSVDGLFWLVGVLAFVVLSLTLPLKSETTDSHSQSSEGAPPDTGRE